MSTVSPIDPGYPRPMAPTEEEKGLALASWLLSIFTGFLGPLIIFIVKKDSKFVSFHAMQGVVIHLAILVGTLLSIPLMLVLIGFITIFVIPILGFVFSIIAAVKGFQGELYEIPVVGPIARSWAGL